MKKIFVTTLLAFFFVLTLNAKTQNSTQGHDGAITAIAVTEVAGKRIVYTGGEDGFLIRWNERGQGEHFQISDDSIKMIAVHPNGNDVAVYESDGLTVNRISVWNWRSLEKRFPSKRIDSTITSLSYSAKGSEIMIGQANVMGIIFIDSTRGSVLSNKIKDNASTITFSQTSSSENSSVMYSSLGQLIYTDLKTGNRRAAFKVESNLKSPLLFNNDVLFAGSDSSRIFIFDSTSGTLKERVSAKNPIIVSSREDSDLYYFETDGRTSSLKMIEVINGVINPVPIILKNFTFETWDTPTSAYKFENSIYIGMKSGNLYSVEAKPSVNTESAQKITKKVYERIHDIEEFNNEFYFLSDDAVFKSSLNNKNITVLAENSGYTNMIVSEDTIILWSKSTRKQVTLINLIDNSTSVLFTPTNSLEMLKLQGERLLILEGSNKVSVYDTSDDVLTNLYTGTGIQDAILFENDIYVTKTSASNPQSSLIQVNLHTRETIPINIQGEVSFSLSDYQDETKSFYGASIVYENNATTTKIFSFNPTTKAYSVILSLADEDPKAFTYVSNGVLYTNVGRTQIYSVTLQQKQLTRIAQSASLPMQIVGTRTNLAVLNKDGSVSWFNAQTKRLIKNWYISEDGTWLEF